MAKQNACGACAQRPGSLNEFELTRAQHLPAHQPRVPNPADHGQRQDHVGEAWAKHRHERDREQDPRKGHHHIDAAADEIVYPAAEISRNRSQEDAHHCGNSDDRQSHQQGDARPGQHARKNVAAQFVQTEGMLNTGPLEPE